MGERNFYEIKLVTDDGTPLVYRVHPKQEAL